MLCSVVVGYQCFRGLCCLHLEKQLENVNMCHFSSCDLLHKHESVSVPFPAVCVLEMINFLAENFKMRFRDLYSHATNIHILESPFSVEVSNAPEKLQLELTELQYDSIFHSNFNQEALITSLLLFLLTYMI